MTAPWRRAANRPLTFRIKAKRNPHPVFLNLFFQHLSLTIGHVPAKRPRQRGSSPSLVPLYHHSRINPELGPPPPSYGSSDRKGDRDCRVYPRVFHRGPRGGSDAEG